MDTIYAGHVLSEVTDLTLHVERLGVGLTSPRLKNSAV